MKWMANIWTKAKAGESTGVEELCNACSEHPSIRVVLQEALFIIATS